LILSQILIIGRCGSSTILTGFRESFSVLQIYHPKVNDALIGKKQRNGTCQQKKKSLNGQVTGKLSFVFVDKIVTETEEKC
jgi:hypothetical protein